MRYALAILTPLAHSLRRRFSALVSLTVLLGCTFAAGCAALTNPGVDAIPVRLLPPEMRGKSVEGMRSIPLSLLGQERPLDYRIDGGDVLGVWVEGVLGERGQQPPVQPGVRLENVDLPPATGFPIQVQRDGTISLPLLDPLKVGGMTFKDAEDAIRQAYIRAQILKAGRERIIVSLIRPRTYHILVLRQDSPQPIQTVVTSTLGGGGPEFIGVSRKGTGWEMSLPAYHNDVLTALAKSGGLPGTDALDTVIIERNAQRGRGWDLIMQEFQAQGAPACAPGGPIVPIPLRTKPGTPLAIRPEDVVLKDGDVVFIPAREERLFFTGGLLPSGEHILPRDHDLDVLEAVARVRGVMFNGAFSTSNLAGTVLLPGLGQPTPTLLTVVRRLPGSTNQVSIRVDLNRAVKDARERLLIQPGDFLILQESPGQGITRFVTQMFNVPFSWTFLQSQRLLAGTSFSVPGGVAPTVLTPQSFTVNNAHSFIQSSGVSGTTTTTVPTPIPAATGR
jgi:protein involved in polysaccharide export with SLBB domain